MSNEHSRRRSGPTPEHAAARGSGGRPPVQAMFTDEQVAALAGALGLLGEVIRGEFAYIRAEVGALRTEIVRRLDELGPSR